MKERRKREKDSRGTESATFQIDKQNESKEPKQTMPRGQQ